MRIDGGKARGPLLAGTNAHDKPRKMHASDADNKSRCVIVSTSNYYTVVQLQLVLH